MIWVLTSSFGDGHNTAAQSVAAALRVLEPGTEVVVSDVVASVHPVAATLLQRLYQWAITHAPGAWKMAYGWMATAKQVSHESRLVRPQLVHLRAFIEKHRPTAIVSAYPLYATLLGMLRVSGLAVPPLITVITDSVSVHPSWLSAPSDRYLVADAETRAVLEEAGVASEKVAVTGFPVSLAFTEEVVRPKGRRLLYLPSTSSRSVMETLEALKPRLAAGVELTVLAGKHLARLQRGLSRFAEGNPLLPVTVLGWSREVPQLLMSHDVVITKAGGAILHEAVAAGLPCVIDCVVPGQEEGNADYITRHGCGLRSRSPAETAQCVERLFANNGAEADAMRVRLRELSLPDSALRAAREILAIRLVVG